MKEDVVLRDLIRTIMNQKIMGKAADWYFGAGFHCI